MAETKPQDEKPASSGDRLQKLEAEVARLKAIMRRNGWTLKD